jgi:hypothetical protein
MFNIDSLHEGSLVGSDLTEFILDESVDHGKSVNRLVHGDHVSSVGNLEEMEVSRLLQLSSVSILDVPINVIGILEVSLSLPFSGVSPGFSSSPVTNPILISRVDEDLNISVIEDRCNLGHEVFHPVSQKEGVNKFVTFDPFTASNSENFLDGGVVHEHIGLREIITEWGLTARFTDIINVKLRLKGVS